MRVLLTGASSFTGCWFVTGLAEAGIEVVATCRRPRATYGGLSRRRLDRAAAAAAALVEGCAFGDERFMAVLAADGPFDLVCHHGADVGDFRRPDYDPLAALAANTRNAATVLERLAAGGGRGIVVTGSVFEADTGIGDAGRPAVNAYGLAKTLTWQTLRFHAGRSGLAAGRFVVPHPIGALEKPGFVGHLLQAWLAGRPAEVRHPQLVRDLVHVDFLAAAYAGFCHEVAAKGGTHSLGPSGMTGPLGLLAGRIAAEMRPRLDRPCLVAPADPPLPSDEPLVRCNADRLAPLDATWPWSRSWDRLAEFYRCGQG